MKKIVGMLLAAVMAFSLAACSTEKEMDQLSEPVNAPAASENTPSSMPKSAPEIKSETESKNPPENSQINEGAMEIKGGTNQNDAVQVPLNTKMYGTISDEQGLWYSFTTGEKADATYYITSVNKTVGDAYLAMYLYDEFGKELGDLRAGGDGVAESYSTSELSANTTYYIRVLATSNIGIVQDDTVQYMMIIRTPDDAYSTIGNLPGAGEITDVLEGEINPGTNQDDAAYIPADVRVSGTVRDGLGAWYAFTTAASEGAYHLIAVNETAKTACLSVYLYDEYGEELGDIRAGNDGVAESYSTNELSANTTYYIYVLATSNIGIVQDDTVQYTLTLKAPETQEPQVGTMERID